MKNSRTGIWVLMVMISLASCSREKALNSSIMAINKARFSEANIPADKSLWSTTRAGNGYFSDPKRPDNNQELVIPELMNLRFPLSVPSAEYPDWQSYLAVFAQRKHEMSQAARLHCSAQFLCVFGIQNKPLSPALLAAVKEHFDLAIDYQYYNYRIIYSTLDWLNKNGESAYVREKKAILLQYMRPVAPVPDPSLPDSPNLNPGMAAKMDKLFLALKENDGYIEKIKTL